MLLTISYHSAIPEWSSFFDDHVGGHGVPAAAGVVVDEDEGLGNRLGDGGAMVHQRLAGRLDEHGMQHGDTVDGQLGGTAGKRHAGTGADMAHAEDDPGRVRQPGPR